MYLHKIHLLLLHCNNLLANNYILDGLKYKFDAFFIWHISNSKTLYFGNIEPLIRSCFA